ncbi:hypothetical protein FOL47_001183 [Perkinsus chesapeaki]|uniref:Uncharacterized protein n=1 Tax=Perkinsus chesapeaki TaxID=330153 RepID=A0A7J6MKS9_PERCH|nr:hypothetical protein FOL47_001183 [Perkinsus chesapeaki]
MDHDENNSKCGCRLPRASSTASTSYTASGSREDLESIQSTTPPSPTVDLQISAHQLVPLRAVRTSVLLNIRKTAFERADGDRNGELYTLSEPVERIDEFISHSWNADKAAMMWTLTLRVNFCPAVTLSIFTTLLLAWFTYIDARVVTLIGILIFIITMFWGHRVVSGRLWPGWLKDASAADKMVFFDRCCIDQVDPIRKVAGIKSIGAYLNKCDSFLVLWSDDYFQRLWCVFELACFLKGSETMSKQRPLKLFMMPIQKLVFMWTVTAAVYWSVWAFTPPQWASLVDACMWMLQMKLVVLDDLGSRFTMGCCLTSVDFDSVECTEASDRKTIIELIKEWYGSLEAFQNYAQMMLTEVAKSTVVARERLTVDISCMSMPSIIYGLAFNDMTTPVTYTSRALIAVFLVGRLLKFFILSPQHPAASTTPKKLSARRRTCRILCYLSTALLSVCLDAGRRYYEQRRQAVSWAGSLRLISGCIFVLVAPLVTYGPSLSLLFEAKGCTCEALKLMLTESTGLPE